MDERPQQRSGERPAQGDGTAAAGAAQPGGDEPLEEFYGDENPFAFRPAPAPGPVPPPAPRKARTATGALLTGIALGLRDVFDPERKRDTIAIEREAPGEPVGPQEYEVRLNGSPRDAQAIYRPWVGEDDGAPD